MPKRTNDQRAAQPPEDTQKMYARAYAARLAKQVTEKAEAPVDFRHEPKSATASADLSAVLRMR